MYSKLAASAEPDMKALKSVEINSETLTDEQMSKLVAHVVAANETTVRRARDEYVKLRDDNNRRRKLIDAADGEPFRKTPPKPSPKKGRAIAVSDIKGLLVNAEKQLDLTGQGKFHFSPNLPPYASQVPGSLEIAAGAFIFAAMANYVSKADTQDMSVATAFASQFMPNVGSRIADVFYSLFLMVGLIAALATCFAAIAAITTYCRYGPQTWSWGYREVSMSQAVEQCLENLAKDIDEKADIQSSLSPERLGAANRVLVAQIEELSGRIESQREYKAMLDAYEKRQKKNHEEHMKRLEDEIDREVRKKMEAEGTAFVPVDDEQKIRDIAAETVDIIVGEGDTNLRGWFDKQLGE